MRRRTIIIAACAALIAGVMAAAPVSATPTPPDPTDRLDVYVGTVAAGDVAAVVDLGVDRREIEVAPSGDVGQVEVEVILSAAEAETLAEQGVELEPKVIDGETVAERASTAAAEGGVFRTYSGPGGIKEEMQRQADAHPRIAELQVIGQTVMGEDIVAVKVTRNARRLRDGVKPATVYLSAQHAREWITPEMTRRLLDMVLTRYGSDPGITRLVDRTEMWFVPVANPDGYDHTFQEGQRLWRKNLADNNGNGEVDSGDGVDLNRNFPTRWGYDNEGSSPEPISGTYRGPVPASEPETKALDTLFARITPEFVVNYHSAAELLLHGIGWQVATPSPDDVLYEAMVGDDANPAVPGYDPDISAELYTTNGDTDSHMQEAYGTLGFTPEMGTCESASGIDPNDQWDPDDCGSVFEFPDDEGLIAQEFEKNVPFALAVAASAPDPDDPVSVVGRTAEDFRVDSFAVSYGDPQTVAVWAKRALQDLRLNYRVNGGPIQRTAVAEWAGGERYGFENNDYYAEFRGEIGGTRKGDSVEVWFSGRQPRTGRVESTHFTYTVERDSDNRALVIANEDYTGFNPDYPASVTRPKYLNQHLAALAANGVAADGWDVDAKGVPHDLGVLSHYDVVLWYLGDNRLTQDEADVLTEVGTARLPNASVAERQQYLTIAVRDFLNEGGRLIHAGETTAYYGVLGSTIGGIWYGLDGAPEMPCAITVEVSDCLLLADDFTQYYLGAYSRTLIEAASGVVGTVDPVIGLTVEFGGSAVASNPIDEAGAFRPTSDALPVDQFPQFASQGVAEYLEPAGTFVPVEGRYGLAAEHADNSYMRVARTYDLSAYTAADAPTLAAQITFDTEEDYDHVIVEAHPVGTEDWATLPESGGATTTAVPTECEVGFLLELHPWLEHYLTLGNPCLPSGTSGAWNALTGSSDGWIPVTYDLSAYAGGSVEVVISYVTDPFTGGTGIIVDDTRLVTAGGTVTEAEGFEAGLGAWAVLGGPEGSPLNAANFDRTIGLGGITAAVVTEDTVLLGFGLEQLESLDQRVDVVGAALAHLGLEPETRRPVPLP